MNWAMPCAPARLTEFGLNPLSCRIQSQKITDGQRVRARGVLGYLSERWISLGVRLRRRDGGPVPGQTQRHVWRHLRDRNLSTGGAQL
jgi:hypothetical protein